MYDRLVWEVWMPFLRSAVWYECFSETELILIRFNLVNKNIKFSDNIVSDWSQMWLTFPVIILFSLNCF